MFDHSGDSAAASPPRSRLSLFVAAVVAACASCGSGGPPRPRRRAQRRPAPPRRPNVTGRSPGGHAPRRRRRSPSPARRPSRSRTRWSPSSSRSSPSVVEIQTDAGLGSGIIYDNNGDIVTNAHVVGTSTIFTVTLSNGNTYPATLVGSYTPDDIAVIHVTARA